MSLAEDAAAVYSDPALTDEERLAALEALRVVGLAAISLPLAIGGRTITTLDWTNSILTLTGTGTGVDWPVRIINMPFLVNDEFGLVIRDEVAFTFAPQSVIVEIVSGV